MEFAPPQGSAARKWVPTTEMALLRCDTPTPSGPDTRSRHATPENSLLLNSLLPRPPQNDQNPRPGTKFRVSRPPCAQFSRENTQNLPIFAPLCIPYPRRHSPPRQDPRPARHPRKSQFFTKFSHILQLFASKMEPKSAKSLLRKLFFPHAKIFLVHYTTKPCHLTFHNRYI